MKSIVVSSNELSEKKQKQKEPFAALIRTGCPAGVGGWVEVWGCGVVGGVGVCGGGVWRCPRGRSAAVNVPFTDFAFF